MTLALAVSSFILITFTVLAAPKPRVETIRVKREEVRDASSDLSE